MRYIFSLTILVVTCSNCQPATEPVADRNTSLPIDILEPRETVGNPNAPRLVDDAAGREMLETATAYVMNLMALLEVGSLRTRDPARKNALEAKRKIFREIYNDIVGLEEGYDLSLPTEIPNRIYATTEALAEAPIPEFIAQYDATVSREMTALAALLTPYGERRLAAEVELIRQRLLDALTGRG